MAAPDRLQQLLQMVPNVLVTNSRDTPSIRGQSGVGVLSGLPSFLGGARPRTVVQIDGRTVTFNEFVNSAQGLWDVDHVEVFRTPQTTTQGVNSIAGAIFLRTADPTYDYEARGRLIAGDAPRRQASATVSGPIVGDQLAFRLSGDVYRSIASTKMSGPVAGIKDLNRDTYWTVRAKLLAEPSAVPGLRLLTTYVHAHAAAPQTELAQRPFRDRRDDAYVFGYFKSDVDSVTSTASYRFDDTLESRTTLSLGRSKFRRFAPQGFGQTEIHGHDRSLETILDWKPGSAFSAVGGLSLQRFNLDQLIDLSAARLGVGTFTDKQRSAGLFGEITWRPAERWTVIAGARYQSDGKRRLGLLRMANPLPLDYDRTSNAFLPKLSLAYDLDPDWRFGVLVQRASNPGGVTLDPAHSKQLEFKPEYLWDYEAFARANLFGGRVTLNGNLFYNAIRDAQRELDFDLNSPGGKVGLLQIVSEPRARSYGAELEVRARPTQQLSVLGSIGLLDTRITRTIAPNDPFLGKEFGHAPKFTAAAAVDWAPLNSLHLSAQARHNSGFWGDDSEDPVYRIHGWTVVDARASWRTGPVTIFGYVQNLFDNFHVVDWNGPHDAPGVNATLIEPREMGLGIEAAF
jgi:outer membrane receptor protein involved in Fe transport